jgi:hypothetical protein
MPVRIDSGTFNPAWRGLAFNLVRLLPGAVRAEPWLFLHPTP